MDADTTAHDAPAMDVELAELSAAATAGEWRVILSGHWIETEGTRIYRNVVMGCDTECGLQPRWNEDLAFVVALVNAYRSGDLIPVDHVDRARVEAYKAGLEAAAKVCEDSYIGESVHTRHPILTALKIRALKDTPENVR
jgi:hypothetical protein